MTLQVFNNRYEIKYPVEIRRLPEIKSALSDFLTLDPNSLHDGGYYVRSIYFDSPNYRYYIEKKEGELVRIKARIRSYRSTPDAAPLGLFLELKGRYDRIVVKRRSPIDFALARQLLHEEPIQLDDGALRSSSVLAEFQYLAQRFRLAPCVTVLYHRTPYHGTFYPHVRVTFDQTLQSSPATTLNASSDDMVQALPANWLIMELKYNDRLPRPLIERLRSLGLEQQTYSKYAASIERCFGTFQVGQTRFF